MLPILPFLLLASMGSPLPAAPSDRPDPVLTPEQDRIVQAALQAALDAGQDASHIIVSRNRAGAITRIEVAGAEIWTVPVVWSGPAVEDAVQSVAGRLLAPSPTPSGGVPTDPIAVENVAAARTRRARKAARHRREVEAGGWGSASSVPVAAGARS